MNTIGGIIYAIDWFQLPVELQSQIILIIARSQKHVHFNGFGLVHCSLEVLGKVRNCEVVSMDFDSFSLIWHSFIVVENIHFVLHGIFQLGLLK